MAVPVLTSQLTDTLLDPANPNTSLGTGNAGASETVIHLQGSNCAAMGHSGAVGSTTPTAISQFRGMYNTVTAITRLNNHLHIWVRDLYPVRNKSQGGVSIYLFGTDACLYYATGTDEGYGGGWFHFVINLSTTDRPAVDIGTIPSSNITRIGYCGNISATKGEAFLQNCYYDAIRVGGDGVGITFTGGTSGDRLTFLDCANADNNSYGLLRNIAGSLVCEGALRFGAAGLTTYLQDNLKTISFTNFTVGSGVSSIAIDYYQIIFQDGTTGVTNIDLTDITWKGVSRLTPVLLDLSALGTGDSYNSLRSTFIFFSTVTFNSLCVSNNDSFVECVTIIPTGITLTDPSFSNCDAIILNTTNDLISGGVTNGHNTATGIAYITTNDLAKIANHTFDNTGGTGHAGEITAIGTYSFSGNTFTGYGADASNDAAIYNNSGGAVVINITGGGNTPTIRNGAGASTTVNISVSVDFKIIDKDGNNIDGAQVSAYLVSDDSLVVLADTNITGDVSTTFSGVTPAQFYYRVRKASPLATKYINDSGIGTIQTSTGFSATITLRIDPNNNS